MSADISTNPFAFLTALSGANAIDRKIVAATRATDVKIVSHMTLASKVSTLYAFSGTGKSSLINAGLVPAFLDLGFAVFKTRPRPPYALGSPINAFKEGCIRDNRVPVSVEERLSLLEAAQQQLDALPKDALPTVRRLVESLSAGRIDGPSSSPERSAQLSAHLRAHDDKPLSEFMLAARDFLGPDVPMVIVCDQFEELFVHYYNRPALRAFAESLRDVCDAEGVQAHLLFSMREDWVGSMITLRSVIPDILNSAYRLDPLRVGAAAPALTLPAAARGVTVSAALIEIVLKDLASFYGAQQRVVPHMLAAVQDDPFIELPALQIVGDRLWSTLKPGSTALELEHYARLASAKSVSRSGSVAGAVLDGYLAELLDAQDATEQRPRPDWRRLRIDALYALTDRASHRRALGQKELVAELKAGLSNDGLDEYRNGEGELTPRLLQEVLEPLMVRRLVQCNLGAADGPLYELAHDFMVRSVVKTWNALDVERAEARGLLEERRRQELERFATLARSARRGSRVFNTTLAATALMLVAFGFELHDSYTSRYWLEALRGSFSETAVFTLAGAVVAISAMLRNPPGVLFGLAACAARLTPLAVWYSWPWPTLQLTQWLAVMICLLPAVRMSGLDDVTPRSLLRRWQTLVSLSLDYALFGTVVGASAFLWSQGEEVAYALLWFTAAQIVSIAFTRRTFGYFGMLWLTRDHEAVDPPTRFSQARRFVAIGGLFAVGWIGLAFGSLERGSILYPMGSPIYIAGHAVLVLASIAWAMGRRPFAVRQGVEVDGGSEVRSTAFMFRA